MPCGDTLGRAALPKNPVNRLTVQANGTCRHMKVAGKALFGSQVDKRPDCSSRWAKSNCICLKPKFEGKANLSQGSVPEEGTKGCGGTERALLTQKLEKSNRYLGMTDIGMTTAPSGWSGRSGERGSAGSWMSAHA